MPRWPTLIVIVLALAACGGGDEVHPDVEAVRHLIPFVDTPRRQAETPVRPAQPVRRGALLYYNAPAAVSVGSDVAVGLIDERGVVRVVKVGPSGVTQDVAVHDFGRPDDHGAPALWRRGEDVLVATAWHSSDLYLYRVAGDGAVRRLCRWRGVYTYPRFEEVGGRLRLYVRLEDRAGGHLAYAEIEGLFAAAHQPSGDGWAGPLRGRAAWGSGALVRI